jgi:hypothetical protein
MFVLIVPKHAETLCNYHENLNQQLLQRLILYESLASSDLLSLENSIIRPSKTRGEYLAECFKRRNILTLSMPNNLLNENSKAPVISGNLGICTRSSYMHLAAKERAFISYFKLIILFVDCTSINANEGPPWKFEVSPADEKKNSL